MAYETWIIVCVLHAVVQENVAEVAGFVTMLVVISAIVSVVITCVCIYGARALGARRSSAQQEQSIYSNHELDAHCCRPSEVQLPVRGIPGSTGNLSLFCNEAYVQLQKSTPIDFIQQDDDVYEKLPDLD